LAQSGGDDDSSSKRPSGIMVNADGEFVIAEPDKASWEQFQAKAKSSATAAKVTAGDKELQERGLQCPLDKKMFIDPMKTPCCEKTYCNDCITNALIESDFVCPACQTEGVLIDNLVPDDKAAEHIKEYLKEKETSKATEEAKSPVAASSPVVAADANPSTEGTKPEPAQAKAKSPTPPQTLIKPPSPTAIPTKDNNVSSTIPASPDAVNADEANSKKRPAEEALDNPKIPKAPKAMQQQQQQQPNAMGMMDGMNGMNGMNGMSNMPMNPMNPMMPFGGMNMMNGFPMAMPNMNMPMPMVGMMNPMMGMPGFPPMHGTFPNMNNGMYGGFDMNGGMNGDMNGGMMNGGMMNGGMMNGGMMNGSMGGGMNGGLNGGGMNGGGMNGGGMNVGGMNSGGMNGFNNQGFQPNFNHTGNEDDAYFRKPVNPHRHQNRQRRVRPSDYREL
jgi:protein MPE1